MTIAGTSALMEPSQENWSKQLFQEFSIPTHFLTNLVDAGTVRHGHPGDRLSDRHRPRKAGGLCRP